MLCMHSKTQKNYLCAVRYILNCTIESLSAERELLTLKYIELVPFLHLAIQFFFCQNCNFLFKVLSPTENSHMGFRIGLHGIVWESMEMHRKRRDPI